MNDKEKNKKIADWLSLESIGIREDAQTDEDEPVWYRFKETCRFENGRYSVSLPFRDSEITVSPNKGLAIQQFLQLKRSIDRKPDIAAQIKHII
uniref:Transposase n=1 Tax=Heterorhabditis bacteriophora TaxID=37862 RepID=A0A1I7WCA7_HETBA